jgi:hypothetical protein
LNEQLQGKLLSAYKISQAFPGVPGPRYESIKPPVTYVKSDWLFAETLQQIVGSLQRKKVPSGRTCAPAREYLSGASRQTIAQGDRSR